MRSTLELARGHRFVSGDRKAAISRLSVFLFVAMVQVGGHQLFENNAHPLDSYLDPIHRLGIVVVRGTAFVSPALPGGAGTSNPMPPGNEL